MFFAHRLAANLKVMIEEYVPRKMVVGGIYKVAVNEVTKTVDISYVLNCYESIDYEMSQQKYDEYRSKLLHYCIRTAEMMTATKEIVKVNIDECMTIMDAYDFDCVTKRMEIYA